MNTAFVILGEGEIYIWMEGKQIIILFVVSSHIWVYTPSPKKCDEVYGGSSALPLKNCCSAAHSLSTQNLFHQLYMLPSFCQNPPFAEWRHNAVIVRSEGSAVAWENLP